MRFVPVTCEQRERMLAVIGVRSVDELFAPIPAQARLDRPIALPDGLSEVELAAELEALSNENASGLVSFAGAGCYDHYVPAIVDAVLSKPAFFTAYTPYQPEVSQGTLQAIYEYQSMVCALTGMDVANASVYDGATALTEAALMAARVTKRHRVVVSETVHPEWREVLRTYARGGTIEVVEAPARDGVTDPDALRELAEGAAAVLVASPNFFGCVEDVRLACTRAHEAGALAVVAANPIMLGVMEAPGALGADIVVGEGQPLGNPMSFGGPGLGLFAARSEFLRQMPGRIVGRTVDVEGRPGFVLTMQTREQHIRREKATSNICSNHSLNALAAAVYLSAVGARGLAGIARACIAKAHYLHDALVATGRFERFSDAPFAHEFALRYDGDVQAMREALLDRGYVAGVDAGGFDDRLAGVVIFAVTEKRTKAQIDAFVKEVASL
ncbi:aminomethyl-transferring glycine dehydrogenase subunit GcvPA [Coriobacteriia bacterium Es71-Z0120]|uniref:aminomethyl-transferring glycine dehydrogenase subunit GcvPA n=1 Tax=Parvivirga hydrogeniphila TaxID=2939460 RepID=UPI002260973A|nr:aminomethyl-transferring glycine dehydrogenase subunit GcvPA [Parvivirga hydrogeniphila]MCL4079665.1 aminomethyl-transferring glycine dehydrogenase subunit GcvPA [Parvivirga hydrogeniphila]